MQEADTEVRKQCLTLNTGGILITGRWTLWSQETSVCETMFLARERMCHTLIKNKGNKETRIYLAPAVLWAL